MNSSSASHPTSTPPLSTGPVKFYGVANFDRGAKARWLLTELGLPYENHFLDPKNGGFEDAGFLKTNPLGRVPAVRIHDRAMAESSAIVAYLADTYLSKGFAPTLTDPARMEYNQWMYFAATSLDGFVTRMTIIEELTDPAKLKDKMDTLLSDADDAFQYLDSIFAKSEYIVANRFSAADICLAYHLYWTTLWPEFKSKIDAAPHLIAYLKRMQARPAAVKAEVFSYEE
jgi:glutathione S-transferase